MTSAKNDEIKNQSDNEFLIFKSLEFSIMSTNERILSSFTLPNGTELKNRLLMAPMTTCTGYYDGTGPFRQHWHHYC